MLGSSKFRVRNAGQVPLVEEQRLLVQPIEIRAVHETESTSKAECRFIKGMRRRTVCLLFSRARCRSMGKGYDSV